jgi:hypothetical protein
MKTKNILKIAIFSIALFALLISPVLKSNPLQVRADENDQTCESQGGYCEAYSIKCKSGYVQDNSLSCPSGVGKPKCCIPDPNAGTSQVGQRGLKTIKSSLPEERAESFCKKNFQKGMLLCEKRYGWGTEQLGCQFKVVIADIWCTITVAILDGLGKMFAGLINLEIEWILWALDPGTYGGFAENEGVIQIWEMMRNLVNSLLVLGLIGIAIATILGYKKYAWKQILWKLILVALLVNFSLAIAGTVVDISNYLSGYFLSIAQEENDTLAPRIQKGFGYVEEESNGIKTLSSADIFDEKKYELPKILGFETISKLEEKIKEQQIAGTLTPLEDTEVSEDVKNYDLRFGNFFIIGFIMVLVGGFAVISLLAIFITILFRAFILIVLLGLSPIVFAAWIFPDTEKYWKMWWSNFIKWCFFPAIFSFILYIAVIAMSAMNKVSIGADPATQTIIQMVLFSMFLVGGLIFSIQGGGVVSKTVMQQSSKIGAAVGAFVSKKTSGAITESSTYKKAGKFLTKVPLLGGVGQEMMVAGEKAKAGRVKEHEKNLENVGLGNLKQLEKAPAPSPLNRNAYERRVALTNKLADMGELSQKSVEFIKMHRGDERLNASAITKAIPHYFKMKKGQLVETGNTIENKVEALSRIKPDKIRDKTQTSDFIKNIVTDKINEAKKQGKSEQEIKDSGDKAFDETIQGIVKKLSPAQLAAWWQAVSPKDMVEGQWGGPEGKIAQAIKKDEQAKKKFYEEAIPSSQVLRAASGITSKKQKKEGKQDQDKGPEETPPHPGWVKKGGIWRSQ